MRPAVRKTEPHKAKTGGNLVVVVFFAARTMASALWVGPLHLDSRALSFNAAMLLMLFETLEVPSFFPHFWNFKNPLQQFYTKAGLTQKCIKR